MLVSYNVPEGLETQLEESLWWSKYKELVGSRIGSYEKQKMIKSLKTEFRGAKKVATNASRKTLDDLYDMGQREKHKASTMIEKGVQTTTMMCIICFCTAMWLLIFGNSHFWVEIGHARDHKRGTYELEHEDSWWNHQKDLANDPCCHLLKY